MPKINAILVDYENIQVTLDTLQSVSIENVEVYIFFGQGQKPSVELTNNIRKLDQKYKIELIQIEGKGQNALDFHIAYFLGKLSKDNDNYFFHIISKDTGFDPLIKYLKKNKTNCLREVEIKDIPIFKILTAETPRQKANVYKERLEKGSKPNKKKTLVSAIVACFAKKITEIDAEDIIKILEKDKILSIDDKGKVSYT